MTHTASTLDRTSSPWSTPAPNRNILWARALVDELVRSGLTWACISPGSRSTPLALAFASHPEVRVKVHLDERTSGFFALGVARATGKPAALVCTSGTAGAHYLPAVLEAWYARLPLIAITADRPPELMDAGAGQTMDQRRLFGTHALASMDLGVPEPADFVLRHLRTRACRAFAIACGVAGAGPAGPVHLNAPFREPLAPTPEPGWDPDRIDPVARLGRADGAPFVRVASAPPEPAPDVVESLRRALEASTRPLLVAGPSRVSGPACWGEARAIAALARTLQAPLLADPLSHVRALDPSDLENVPLVTRYDHLLRAERWSDAHTPDCIVRFGMAPTSKPVRLWRGRQSAQGLDVPEWVVDPHGDVLAPTQQAAALCVAHTAQLAEALVASMSPREPRAGWTRAWLDAQGAARAVDARLHTDAHPLWEGEVAAAAARVVPAGGVLWAASSMPVRDVDGFVDRLPPGVMALANRGVNGIDGLIAAALGAAAASGRRAVLLIGDVAFFHDAGSLITGRRGERIDATIVVVNNAGGGIFEHLPIAKHRDHFDALFLTPPQAEPLDVARGYGLPARSADTLGEFEDALAWSADLPGVSVVEARVDRDANLAHHRALWRGVADAADALARTKEVTP